MLQKIKSLFGSKKVASVPNKISTEPYKGVRDFYPEDMAIQNYIFGVWKKTVESFGYTEYGASILEYSNLYKAKSGEEIVNEQTYSFKDRGDREVTLRPEMTPTAARMIAAKGKSFSFPLRWYSIPNLFRYEKQQRGRLREHWQLNCDLFGVEGSNADVEVILIACQVLKNFGLKNNDFEVRIGTRAWLDFLALNMKDLSISEETKRKIFRLIDIKNKNPKRYKDGLKELGLPLDLFDTPVDEIFLRNIGVYSLMKKLKELKINVIFDKTIVRGFDYYTGILFEVFDTNPKNPRAICGGGRYDKLLDIFGAERVSAVGFGMGDVVIHDILETYNLLPKLHFGPQLHFCILDEDSISYAQDLAEGLRNDSELRVSIDYSGKKIGDQIKYADKHKIRFIIVIGEEEIQKNQYKMKDLRRGIEISVREDQIAYTIHSIEEKELLENA